MMAAMAGELTLLLCSALFALFAETGASSTCFIGNSYYEVCEYGCCGTSPYEECCGNDVGLIIGLVVGGMVIICVVVVIVCFVMHYKSNQVIRIVESAHSTRSNANITILHMGPANPYEQPHHQPPMGATTTHGLGGMGGGYPNHAPGSMAPPDVPSGFPHGAPGAAHPSTGFPASSGGAPGFPTGGKPFVMTPGGPPMTSTSTMNGGPVMTSTSLPKKVPPLPVIPVASPALSTPEPGPPAVAAFGASGRQGKEPTAVAAGPREPAKAGGDMGLEDLEDFD